LEDLKVGTLYSFADWPNPDVPNWQPGVYTVWDGDQFVYVGMAGRGMVARINESSQALASKKTRGLRDRLRSHASGRRSGDQFCIYVFDRLVLPSLDRAEIAAASDGRLSLDALTRDYIHKHLSYRFVVSFDGRAALALERAIQKGALGFPPLLNPLR
jgi:hypothetical protein